MKLKCPICKIEVVVGAPDFPFCSERCRMIDLGNWAMEKYKIPAPRPLDDDPGEEGVSFTLGSGHREECRQERGTIRAGWSLSAETRAREYLADCQSAAGYHPAPQWNQALARGFLASADAAGKSACATVNSRTKAAMVVATWFGCGYSPFAPGTAGSAAALAIGIALHEYAGFGWWQFLVLAGAGFYPAVWAATITARAVKKKDPSIVVVDEVIGQWIALAGALRFNWKSCLAAFLLFRFFDIWKPPPVRQLEALPEGLGINADDVMAGVYAALVLLAAGWFNLY